MRPIDADRLLEERRIQKYYHLPNGDTAIPIIDIEHAPTIELDKRWIPCSERLPDEHDSIFSRFYGTEKWRNAMFRKTSDTVICTVQYRDGTRQTAPCYTIDGEWNQSMKGMGKVLAWMPLPEPWKEVKE